MERSRLFLLDANIVLETLEQDIWETLIQKVDVTLPSVVVEQEVKFFFQGTTKVQIDLRRYVDSGQIRSVACDASDIQAFLAQFDRVFIERIHHGEIEALALLAAGQLTDHLFCTADGPAVLALALAGMSESGVSLEELLRTIGLTKRLAPHYRSQFFREKITAGQGMRIRGEGLSAGSRFRVR